MSELKHYKGFDQDLTRGTKPSGTRKTDAFYREAKRYGLKGRPSGNYHANARKYSVPISLCDKCDSQAEIKSIKDGEVEYQLCLKCYAERNDKKNKD